MGKQVENSQFLTLLTTHQRRLIGFLRTLVPNRNDAEEILQEVNVYIWEHADEFEPGTDFAAWALKIAHFCVLTARKRQSRDRLLFDDTLFDRLSATAYSLDPQRSRHKDALESCLQKLRSRERELITQLYSEAAISPQTLAQRLGRSVKGLYVSIYRIRVKLLECIERTLTAEDRA
jgi:RNA polymerase sigma-70 factor (ECF subfamily)